MPHFRRNDRAAKFPARLSRSWLLVSAAADEETLAAALESEADSVILDLEDGCPEDQKDACREKVVRLLEESVIAWGHACHCRTPRPDNPHCHDARRRNARHRAH